MFRMQETHKSLEVWEWMVATIAYSDLGTAYLGVQGDPWDAQKDIILAPLGALAGCLLFSSWHDRLIAPFELRLDRISKTEAL